MSLLEKAKNTHTSRQTITQDHIELAEAFVRSEIGLIHINTALGYPKRSTQGYITVCRALRHAYSQKQGAKHGTRTETNE